MDARRDQGIPFKTCVEELLACTEAVCGFCGGIPPTFEEGLRAFSDFAARGDHFRGASDPIFHGSEYLGGGDEHEVRLPTPSASIRLDQEDLGAWGDPSVVKITYPGLFGLRVVYRQDESRHCTPLEYFERWQLHCEMFGDDAEFLGVVKTSEGLRTVIRQKLIEGEPASDEEIDQFFRGNEWLPFRWNNNLAYFDEAREVVVSDTHPGNLVKMPDGKLAPIDLRVQRAKGGVLDAIRRMI